MLRRPQRTEAGRSRCWRVGGKLPSAMSSHESSMGGVEGCGVGCGFGTLFSVMVCFSFLRGFTVTFEPGRLRLSGSCSFVH